MDIGGWMRESLWNIRRDGLRGVGDSLYPAYVKLFHLGFRFAGEGVPIYDREWDLLVVLDGCRMDLMTEVADEYAFIESVDSATSVDTMTQPWMMANFGEDYRSETAGTAYVCGSPFSDATLDAEEFLLLEEVWKDGWNDDLGTVLPRAMTDRAIEVGRDHDPERMVVHYLQPHHPFIPDPELDPGQSIENFNEEAWDDIWDRLRHGEVSKERVWNAYRENLRYVLADVELLLENVDAETVVITSDHGNAFGEWGIYGHPMHTPLSCLRTVPWIETEAKDTESRESEEHVCSVASDVQDRLRQLGYQ